jgi:D-alanine transaminase
VILYCNDEWVAPHEARVSVFDRGFLFGDGVYEGLRAFDGVIVDIERHIRRMTSGLAELRITGFDPQRLHGLSGEILRRNGLHDAFVYWQITRGAPATGEAVRTRLPAWQSRPTLMGFAIPSKPLSAHTEPATTDAATVEDTRWTRLHVKSIALSANIVGAIEAQERGAGEAIFVRDGLVSEATASNVFAVIDGQVVTPELGSPPMLEGVTRALVLGADPSIIVRPLRIAELRRADEVMLVGSTAMVTSVTTLDDAPVGDGGIGPHARRLLGLLVDAIRADQARTRGGAAATA